MARPPGRTARRPRSGRPGSRSTPAVPRPPAHSIEARRRAQERGQGWLGPLHLFVAGEIDRVAGRWDDALAELDTGLESAALSGGGWLSRGTAGVLQMQMRRGELEGLEAAQERWRLRGLPEQFGLPVTALTTILLAEAHGRHGDVTDLARESWTTALDGGRLLWALLAGPDIARLALDAGDQALLRQVAADTAAVPVEQTVGLAPAVDLVAAMADADTARAAAAAAAYDNRGHAAGALGAWEEAAVAAAASGDGERARSCARRCTDLAASLGAAGTVRRLTARLRAHDVRLGVSGSRRRPASGWQSLTPTERQVAELVGPGLTSPQIGAQPGRLSRGPGTGDPGRRYGAGSLLGRPGRRGGRAADPLGVAGGPPDQQARDDPVEDQVDGTVEQADARGRAPRTRPARAWPTAMTATTPPHAALMRRLIERNSAVCQYCRGTVSRAYCSVNGITGSSRKMTTARTAAAIARP